MSLPARLLPVLLLSLLGACGGGGNDSGWTPTPAAGLYERAGSTSPADEVLVLDSGRAYDFYGMNASTAVPVRGVAVGDLSISGNTLSASSVSDFDFSAHTVTTGSASGSWSLHTSLDASIVHSDSSTLSFGGGYSAALEGQASLADLAGSYGGQLSDLGGTQVGAITADASGALAGSSTGGCQWVGLASPHTSGKVYDITLSFQSGCTEAGKTLHGHAFVRNSVLYLAVMSGDATRAVAFAGLKS